jgi:hypothetical protein
MYIQDVTTIPLLLQLLEQVAPHKYETKAVADNKVKIQPTSSDSYRAIIKALAKKCTEFRTYKPKEDRSYRVVLKNMHYSINPADIKTNGETVICGNKHMEFQTKSHQAPSFHVFCGVETCPEQQGYIPCLIPPAVQNQI